MIQLKFVFLVFILFVVSPISTAKKRCKPLLEKLHNIQAMQRNGYSSKRGTSLRAREDNARDSWWQCEQGRGKKNKNKNKNKNKKKQSNETVSYRSKIKSVKSKKMVAATPFKTNSAIVIKSKYRGEKKHAWIAFYQQPTRCQRPKNLQVFAFCSEDKQTQRVVFEQKFNE